MPGAALDALLDRLGSAAPAQLRISATSTFGSLPALRPQNLLGGTGWIAAGPAAAVHLSWKGRRAIGEIRLTAPTTGIAAQPTRVLITSPDGTRDVPVPSSGILRFPPLVTDRLDISFPGVVPATAYNPLAGRAEQLPVGLGALTIPALAGLRTGIPAATAPFHLACGQGPPLTVDGRTYPTSVSGTVRDLISLTPLPLRVCTGGAVLALPAGRHWLSSPGTDLPLAITDLSLTDVAAVPAPGRAPAPASAAAPRGLRIGTWGAEYRTMTIGPGGLSYLEVHQAASPGWTATLNGHLLTPVTLDGWQQAFVVPAGAGGTVVMTFTPAGGYHWLLAGSVLALCVLIAAAAWPPRRGPRDRAASAGAGGRACRVLAGGSRGGAGAGPGGRHRRDRNTGRDPAGLVAAAMGAVAGVRRDVRRWSTGHRRIESWCPARLRRLRLARAGRGPDRPDRRAYPACSPAMAEPGRRCPRCAGGRRMTAVRSARGRAGPASWPLTPIEELDHYLDSAADPSLIQLELLVGMHLDVAILAAALAKVLAGDPAVRRHLEATSRWRRRLRWETGAPGRADGVLTVARWRSPGQLAALREWVAGLADSAVRSRGTAGPGGRA